MSSAPIYLATVTAPTNIAVIKYWGKASLQYNTPINSSISVTLDQADLRAVTTVAASPAFTQDRLWLNGVEDEGAATHKRFRACVDGVKALATTGTTSQGTQVTAAEWQTWKVHVSSYNTFPTAAGLASSAAGYAALVAALAELFHAKESFTGELSTLARQGSGSACRSLYGNAVAWRMGSAANDWKDSKAEPVANGAPWSALRALILVVSDQKKDTSSTAGMVTSVETSTLLKHRAEAVVPERMVAMEAAWAKQDFGSFARLTMQDSNQFHATCLDTYPPIFYLNDTSRDIMRLVTIYNKWAGEGPGTPPRAAYTFDAGPNAVIYTLDEHLPELTALLLKFFPPAAGNPLAAYVNKPVDPNLPLDPSLIEACAGRSPQPGTVQYFYQTKAGPGPQVVTGKESNLDPQTGLNTYQPTK
jgi:diphosphomevalonate decarboxylase